jgi:hypothetical protein
MFEWKTCSKAEAAEEYARQGWWVLPIVPGTKRPLTPNGLLNASKDVEQVREWWSRWPEANIGVRCGEHSMISVIDIDTKGAKVGAETIAKLFPAGAPAGTVRQRTWSGGEQWVFFYDHRASNAAPGYGKDVDGRNNGTYVIVPPSEVQEPESGLPKGRYEWIVAPFENTMTRWPAEVLVPAMAAYQLSKPRALRRAGEGMSNPAGWAKELLENGAPEGERNPATWRLINHLFYIGATEEECHEKIIQFAERCTPPSELEWNTHKRTDMIRRAYSGERPEYQEYEPPSDAEMASTEGFENEDGYTGPEPQAAPEVEQATPEQQEKGEVKQEPGLFNRLLTVREAIERLGETQDWIVDGLLGKGSLAILNALPGAGKSRFAQWLARCVALGEPFLDRETQPGLVVYLAFEGAQQTALAFRRMGLQDHQNLVVYVDGPDLGPKPTAKGPTLWLKKIVEGRVPALIIVDVFQDLLQIAEGNSYAETYNALGPLLRFAQRNKVALVGLHHAGKDQRQGVGSGIGSIGFGGKPDTVLTYTMSQKAGPRLLQCEKQRLGEDGAHGIPDTLTIWDRETGEVKVATGFEEDPVGPAPAEQPSEASLAIIRRKHFERLILKELQKHPEGLKRDELKKAPDLQIKASLFSAAMLSLIAD